ncbi:hypothetical protein PRZ48_005245 [Zasmidium cellare]|uniref:PPPDE domain-containing protein n=1 Tax=Zasmidium cellare TaxID=395010 RepID=A0ABR0ESH2_ZASCE|nr:hypothetical protein PRZ48_005245 [Zasmidium cellare]
MAERPIWIFATPAGHKGTHPGNSSHISVPFQVFGAGFHHWGIFVAEGPGDPSKPKDEKKSFLGRFAGSSSSPNENRPIVQGTFFELTRARDRDIDTLTRTREVRELEEQNNAKWITFESTGCTTVRSDAEIDYIGKLICRENMSSDYALVGKNCQDWVNLLGNRISTGRWIPLRTLQDIVDRLSWSKPADRRRMYGHSSDALPRIPFGTSSAGASSGQSSSSLRSQQNQPGASTLSREEYNAQILSQSQTPNYASPSSLTVPPNNPTIEMVDAKKFTVLIYSYNGEHRRAVKEVAESMRIRPTFLVRMTSHEIPIDFNIRRFKDACLVRLGGKNAELAVNVDFSAMEARQRPRDMKGVLWHIVDHYKLIRSEPEAYDVSYGWIAELRARVGEKWHLLLRFRTETMSLEQRPAADEHWRFAPKSSKPTGRVEEYDTWAASRDLDEDINERIGRLER